MRPSPNAFMMMCEMRSSEMVKTQMSSDSLAESKYCRKRSMFSWQASMGEFKQGGVQAWVSASKDEGKQG